MVDKIWSVYLFEENHWSAALLKVPVFSAELVVVIFVLKLLYWMHKKHVQLSPSFMVNVLICQFHNSNCSYLISIVNFLEEQL